MDFKSQQLFEKYQEFLLLNKTNKRFYHINSVRNFIFHFDKISHDSEKEHIYKLLKEYLEYVVENDIIDILECRLKFEQFIYPVGKYYEENCEFSIFIKWYISTFYMLVISTVLYFFQSNFILYLFAVAGCLIFYSYTLMKMYSKRLYGFSW